MRFVSVYAVISVMCICGHSSAQQPGRQDMDLLAKYITEHQFKIDTQSSYGAIWTFSGPSESGDTVYKVVPYFAHYAARGLLRCDSSVCNAPVRNWMNWYLSHLDSLGRMVNHYYSGAGATDSTAGPDDIDAQDADPALFWVLAREYYVTTGDKAFFTSGMKKKMEAAAKFITANLMDVDHLTYASENFAMKYTMDNSEVYEGLMALSAIEKEAYQDIAMYNSYRGKAAATQAAIKLRLYDPVAGLYMNSANTKTDPRKWYETGIVATLWPQFCGVDGYKSDRSVQQRDVLCQNFNDKNGKDWTTVDFIKNNTDSYPWAAVGYIYSMAGDTTRGHQQLSYVVQLFKDPAQAGHCNIEEAGWGLMHLATIFKK